MADVDPGLQALIDQGFQAWYEQRQQQQPWQVRVGPYREQPQDAAPANLEDLPDAALQARLRHWPRNQVQQAFFQTRRTVQQARERTAREASRRLLQQNMKTTVQYSAFMAKAWLEQTQPQRDVSVLEQTVHTLVVAMGFNPADPRVPSNQEAAAAFRAHIRGLDAASLELITHTRHTSVCHVKPKMVPAGANLAEVQQAASDLLRTPGLEQCGLVVGSQLVKQEEHGPSMVLVFKVHPSASLCRAMDYLVPARAYFFGENPDTQLFGDSPDRLQQAAALQHALQQVEQIPEDRFQSTGEGLRLGEAHGYAAKHCAGILARVITDPDLLEHLKTIVDVFEQRDVAGGVARADAADTAAGPAGGVAAGGADDPVMEGDIGELTSPNVLWRMVICIMLAALLDQVALSNMTAEAVLDDQAVLGQLADFLAGNTDREAIVESLPLRAAIMELKAEVTAMGAAHLIPRVIAWRNQIAAHFGTGVHRVVLYDVHGTMDPANPDAVDPVRLVLAQPVLSASDSDSDGGDDGEDALYRFSPPDIVQMQRMVQAMKNVLDAHFELGELVLFVPAQELLM